MTEKVAVSRAAFIQYPFGRQLGEVGGPGDRRQQRRRREETREALPV